jgi:hypothetical protein
VEKEGEVDYFINQNIAANADLKFCLVKTSGSRRYLSEPTATIDSINLNSLMLEIGIKYFF